MRMPHGRWPGDERVPTLPAMTTEALQAGDLLRADDVLDEATARHWRDLRTVFLPLGWRVLLHPGDDFYVMLALPGADLSDVSRLLTPTLEPSQFGVSWQPSAAPGDNPARAVEFDTADALLAWLSLP